MTSEEKIKERLEKLAQAISPEETLIENVMSQIDPKPIAGPSIGPAQNIWRTIMKSPITKLAVAAVLIAAVALSIAILDKSATPVYGITDIPELFNKARTIHIQGRMYFPRHTMPDGQEIPPVETEKWIDLENGRVRFTTCGLSSNRDDIQITVGETISDGQFKLALLHTDRRAIFFKMSEYQQMLEKRHTLEQIFGQMFGDIDKLASFVKTGQEKIDGIEYDIWEGEVAHSVTKDITKYKYWLSPSTGESNRIQAWVKQNDVEYKLQYEYNRIERDVAIPDGIFSTDVPQGYELKNTKQTAIYLELDDGGSVHYGNLSLDSRITFTLSNGSVILGWYSLDRGSEKSQKDLFENLEFGGALPKLPVEIWGLKPSGWTGDMIYVGQHLAHTLKGGKFIEWSLYVPEYTPPERSEMFGYDVLYRFNLEEEPKWRIAYTLEYGIEIKSEQDFDILVLGAIAELSDDDKAPDDISYESVLQLAERIRGSMAQ